jgi:hypothetical protein
MRSFKFYRKQDLTGTSGTGFVAAGQVKADGSTFVRWTVDARLADGSTRKINSVTQFETWVDAVLLHGHGGRTVLIWDDTGETVSDLDLLSGIKAAA